MTSRLRRLLGRGGGDRPRGRTRGDPPSPNGASSFHLFWDLPGRFAAVTATLEVLEPPVVPRLYFWALQAGFVDAGRDGGAAHLGLQWHPSHPASTAVNWGGYRPGGGELDGTTSALPSALANPNTRDYRWERGVAYRLHIGRSPGGAGWRGTVTNRSSGVATVVRDLLAEGTHLHRLMVWSEVFARCDHPSVTIRWSDLAAFDDAGVVHRPNSVVVNYQTHHYGGCANTTTSADAVGFVQRTCCDRTTPPGSRLALPPIPRSEGDSQGER